METVFQATFSEDLNCPKHYGYKDGQLAAQASGSLHSSRGTGMPAVPAEAGQTRVKSYGRQNDHRGGGGPC